MLYSENELRRPDSCALPDFTNCLLRSQFAKSCKCSESKRAYSALYLKRAAQGQPPVVCYRTEIARKIRVRFQFLGKSSEADRPCYALSSMSLVLLAIAGKISPNRINANGVMMFNASWNHHDDGSWAMFIFGTIPMIHAKAVRKKAQSPTPKPTYLFLTNI